MPENVINLEHYRTHRIPIRERLYAVEPAPRLGVNVDVQVHLVTDDCDHPVVVRGNEPDCIRVTCIVCGRGLVFPPDWGQS